MEAGAVGMNIEDGVGPPDLLSAKIEAARESALRTGVDVFINPRTDVYLRDLASGDAAVEEVVRRAKIYQAAGCDGLFVPGLADGPAIEAIAAAIHPLPLNIMLMAGPPSAALPRGQGRRRLASAFAYVA